MSVIYGAQVSWEQLTTQRGSSHCNYIADAMLIIINNNKKMSNCDWFLMESCGCGQFGLMDERAWTKDFFVYTRFFVFIHCAKRSMHVIS